MKEKCLLLYFCRWAFCRTESTWQRAAHHALGWHCHLLVTFVFFWSCTFVFLCILHFSPPDRCTWLTLSTQKFLLDPHIGNDALAGTVTWRKKAGQFFTKQSRMILKETPIIRMQRVTGRLSLGKKLDWTSLLHRTYPPGWCWFIGLSLRLTKTPTLNKEKPLSMTRVRLLPLALTDWPLALPPGQLP